MQSGWVNSVKKIDASNANAQLAALNPEITHIYIQSDSAIPVNLMLLTRCSWLNSLTLYALPKFNPQDLYFLVSRLSTLSLRFSKTDNSTIEQLLGPGNNLATLSISGRYGWSPNSMGQLKHNTRLKSLSLHYVNLNKKHLCDLSFNTTLTELSIEYKELSYRAKKLLCKNSNLRGLHLLADYHSYVTMRTNIAKRLFSNIHLTAVTFDHVHLPEEAYVALSHNQTLTSLAFSFDMLIPEKYLTQLVSKTQLRSLSLPNVPDTVIPLLTQLTALQALRLNRILTDSALTKPTVSAILKYLNLEFFAVYNQYLDENCLAAIQTSSSLRKLEIEDIGESYLHDDAFHALSRNTTLINLGTLNVMRDRIYTRHNIDTVLTRLCMNQFYWGSLFYWSLRTISFIARTLNQNAQKNKTNLSNLPIDTWRIICKFLIKSFNLPHEHSLILETMFNSILVDNTPDNRLFRYSNALKALGFFGCDTPTKIRDIKTQGKSWIEEFEKKKP